MFTSLSIFLFIVCFAKNSLLSVVSFRKRLFNLEISSFPLVALKVNSTKQLSNDVKNNVFRVYYFMTNDENTTRVYENTTKSPMMIFVPFLKSVLASLLHSTIFKIQKLILI